MCVEFAVTATMRTRAAPWHALPAPRHDHITAVAERRNRRVTERKSGTYAAAFRTL